MTKSRSSEILVADDDGVMRNLLHALLARAGYRVQLAADGNEVLAQCSRKGGASGPASLALLDLTMPNRDGISTCQSLRQLTGWRHVPIVMLTANGTDRAVRAALNAGADGFVVKPFAAENLLQRVALWVAHGASNEAAAHLSRAAAPGAARGEDEPGPQGVGPDSIVPGVLGPGILGPGLLGPGILGPGSIGRGSMPGVAWSIGRHGLAEHERGETTDISHLLLAKAGLQPL
jgi:CheY-like chemotaxis protein